jgi:hypothetical protein
MMMCLLGGEINQSEITLSEMETQSQKNNKIKQTHLPYYSSN